MFARWLIGLLLLAVTLSLAGLWGWQRQHRPLPPPASPWVEYEGFPWLSQAPLSFPKDHGFHDTAPLELWQLQGTLTSGQETMGLQLMVLALTLHPEPVDRPSAWGARRLLLAWFATTLAAPGRFLVQHREEREALGLSEATRGHLVLDDWKLEFDPEEIRIVAGERNDYLHLTLRPLSPPAEIGEPSSALRTYLIAKMTATGTYGEKEVSGSIWLEHSWGRLPLPAAEVSLQRLQLRLKGGSHLTCLQMQRRNSRTPGPARCLLIRTDGTQEGVKSVRLFPTSHWRDENDKVYPTGWRLESPGLALDIDAVFPAQIIEGPLAGWSGWVIASDEHGIQGEGFMQAPEVER